MVQGLQVAWCDTQEGEGSSPVFPRPLCGQPCPIWPVWEQDWGAQSGPAGHGPRGPGWMRERPGLAGGLSLPFPRLLLTRRALISAPHGGLGSGLPKAGPLEQPCVSSRLGHLPPLGISPAGPGASETERAQPLPPGSSQGWRWGTDLPQTTLIVLGQCSKGTSMGVWEPREQVPAWSGSWGGVLEEGCLGPEGKPG